MPDPAPDRTTQIITLLQTRNDHLPQPTRHVAYTAPGFIHHTQAPTVCPTCDGLDDTRTCPTCRGRREIYTTRHHDPYTEDLDHAFRRRGQTPPPVTPYGLRDTAKLGHDPARDNELDRLAQQTAPPPASEQDILDTLTPYSWELERNRRYATYDYHALDQALDKLRDHDPAAYTLLHSVYVYGWTEPSAALEAIVARGLQFLDERMPDPIRSPGHPHPALDRRNRRATAA